MTCFLSDVVIFQSYDSETSCWACHFTFLGAGLIFDGLLSVLLCTYACPLFVELEISTAPSVFFSLFRNSPSESIATTPSLPLLSGRLDTHSLQFKLLSNLNQRLQGFVICCRFCFNRRVSGPLSCLIMLSIIFLLTSQWWYS